MLNIRRSDEKKHHSRNYYQQQDSYFVTSSTVQRHLKKYSIATTATVGTYKNNDIYLEADRSNFKKI